MAPHSSTLAWKIHGRRSLVGCSPWGREESGTTEQLHFPFSLSCIGEGNGNPLQYSCLENPRDSRAWWAAVCGVTQSRTRLKRLSSSSEASMYPSQTAQTPHHILVLNASKRRTYYDFSFMPWRRKWQPTPVFLPGESQGQRSLVGCRLWGHTESDITKVT